MAISGLAIEVYQGEAVPNLNASQPSLTSNTVNLPITNNPPATGLLVPPQSPSGSVTGQSATWNYNNTETSTQNYTAGLNSTDGVPMAPQDLTNPPAPPGYNIAQTKPNAPTGTFVQQGTATVSGVQTFSAMWMQGNVFKFQ
jgi:hypothetical protein